MSNVIDLILELAAMDIRIYLEQGILKVDAPEGVALDTVLPRIKSSKAELVSYLLSRAAAVEIPVVAGGEHYALSSAQHRLWVLSQVEEGSVAYNMPGLYTLEGRLDRNALAAAFAGLVERHESLRTVFREVDEEVRQYILPAPGFALGHRDVRHLVAQPEAVPALVQEELSRAFDLANGPLLRATVYELADDRCLLAFALHHIVGDGWSMEVLMKELFHFYNSHANGEAYTLSPLRVQYKDYAAWEQQQMSGPALEAHKSYWLERFSGTLPVLEIPADRPRPALRTYNGATVESLADGHVLKALKALVQKEDGTLFMGAMAAVNALLYKYSGQEDIIIGTPAAGREHHELRGQIGFYVNTLALRTAVKGDESFAALLRQVRRLTLDAYEHQLYPFDALVDALALRPDASRHPLFDVMVQVQERPVGTLTAGELKVSRDAGLAHTTSKFDLLFDLVEEGDALRVRIEYNTDIYTADSAHSLASHLIELLKAAVADPALPVGQLNYLSESERELVVEVFNDTAADYPRDQTLPALFEAQVALRPDATALVFEDRRFTYADLNAQANRLARYLRAHYPLQADDRIVVQLERSERMIISLLAVLKAGAAYVPVDPQYPAERIAYMVQDSHCKALLTEEELDRFYLEQDQYSTDNLEPLSRPTDLAYVIYTSGSTGKPKGCLLEHRGVINRLEWMWAHYGFDRSDVILQKTTFTFDVSVWELFLPLCWGAKMVLCRRDDIAAPERIASLIGEQGVTCLHFVPGMLNIFITALNEDSSLSQKLGSLRRVITSGEALLPATVSQWYDKLDTPIHNLYGPTEASVDVTYYATQPNDTVIPIGRPIWNTQLYIVDAGNQPSGIGVAGEICIGGDGLARGYLNRPELTEERFVPNPFQENTRLYRTGDIGRWLPDGNIEYLGRRDEQVKIRGYRIELGEIETALQQHGSVEAAAVLAIADATGDKELVAYLVGTASAEELRAHLGARLPMYMVPQQYVSIDALPLTASGKTDRRALAQLGRPEGSGREYIAPRTETEQKLVAVWQDILGRERIGIRDNFFDLGGHSLKATRLVSRLHKVFQVRPTLVDLFTHPILEDQARLLTRSHHARFNDIQPIPGSTEGYALSAAQHRLWILSQFEDGNIAYNMPGACRFAGTLDSAALAWCFDRLIARHESLRTVFHADGNDTLRQHVRPATEHGFTLQQRDLRNTHDSEAVAQDLIQQETLAPFDLASGPLVRVTLYRLADDQWVLGYVLHHIISDGWSMGVLLNELLALYNARTNGEAHALLPLRIQYKDYAAWEQEQAASAAFAEHKAYWLDQFAGELPVLELAADHSRPAVKTYNGSATTRQLGRALGQRLKALADNNGATLYMTLLAGVNALLYRYTGQDDLVIGSAVAGREHNDLEEQIGFYVNMLALRTKLSGNESFEALLDRVRTTMLAAYEHQSYPFDELVEAVRPGRDQGRHPLFDVVVVLHNVDHQASGTQQLNGVQVEPFNDDRVVALFDLHFDFKEVDGELSFVLKYNTDIYSHGRIGRMADNLVQLLTVAAHHPTRSIDRIDYISAAEKSLLPTTFTSTGYPADATIVSLFEAQAERTPENIAVVMGDVTLTYRELNERANRIAHFLINTIRLQSGEGVGLLLERGPGCIVSMLGILKAGGGYIPMETDTPEDRLHFMISDTAMRLIITGREQQDMMERLQASTPTLTASLYLDTDETLAAQGFGCNTLKTQSSSNPGLAIDPSALAYVIYTSGTTGKPKGVLIEHRNVVRLLVNDAPLFDFNEHDVWTMFHSYCFDFSVWEMYGALLFGGKLVLVPKAVAQDAAAFRHLLEQQEVTILNQTPSAFYNLIKEELEQEKSGLKIRSVIFGGEALSPGRLAGWHQKYPQTELINMYGITETTVHVTYKKIGAPEIATNSASIGQAIPTLYCYVLDAHQQLLPIGVDGELYVGGDGVARGYLNRPELTAARFIDDPFRKGERLYRSGDKARLLPDGELEYGGRIDLQVKIRGYRIELGEIEATLQKHQEVEAAVVVARASADGEKELVAYLVAHTAVTASELAAHLGKSLPAYMLPARYVLLDRLPLTANGKVDKKALPDPDGVALAAGNDYVAPRNTTEEKLVAIWKELLDRERISVKDDFFGLGGHSLRITKLASQIHKEFDVKLPLRDLFACAVLEDQARLIGQAQRTGYKAIVTVAEQKDYPLSAAQRRLWVVSQLPGGNVAHTIPDACVFEGPLHVHALSTAFDTLVMRHESLRTVFRENAVGEVRQVILSPEAVGFAIVQQDLRGTEAVEEKLQAIVNDIFGTAFDLSTGPLLRAVLCRVAEEKWVLAYALHHIVSDGWSMDVLMKELMDVYEAVVAGKPVSLKPLRIQYKDYAAWQQEQLGGEALQAQKAYWLEQLAGELPVLSLMGDKPRPAAKSYRGATATRVLPAALVARLRAVSGSEGATLFMALLAGVNALLYKYGEQEDLIIGTQIAGREHNDLDGQIGMYLNTLALRTRFSGADSFRALLARVRRMALDAYEHQLYPFDELLEALDLQRDASRNPLFDVSVVLHNHAPATAAERALKVRGYEGVENRTSKFDLAFDLVEVGDELVARLVYNSDVYAQSTTDRLLAHLESLIDVLTAQPDISIAQVSYLSIEEQDQLLNEFNDTKVAYPSDQSIASLFEAQVLATPNKTALIFGDKQLTYKELNEQANKLAAYLRSEHHVRPDDKVAIMLDRSEALPVAILGVLKSGAAYVPVDVDYPSARKQFILNDTQAQVLITQSDYLFELDYFNGSLFAIDVQLDGLEEVAALENISKPTDLAYVMYTSGSTGTPKGVLIEQRSVVRLVKSSTWLSFSGEEVILSTGAVSFDATTFEYWAALLNGGTLVLCTKETLLDEQKLAEQILSNHVDTMWFTSGWLNQLIDKDISVFHGLKTIVAGGDKLSPQHIRSLRNAYPDVQIINGYGPTENTTFSLTYKIGSTVEPILIGKPINNSTAYILDAQGGLCPIGVVGEICVGGDGLARGYLNNEELTEQKFIHHTTLGRLYKTGDLGRWLADGNIEFLGRKDSQVKVRGFRIEPGEIENALQAHAQVEAAVIVIRGDEAGEKQIVAYVVSAETLAASELRAFLSQQLPSYMLPDRFVQLEALPLNANGKVDRKALPDEPGMDSGTQYIAPRTETEIKLAAIWSEILNRSTVSATDNFFEIGGHSLKATRLASQIHREFNVKMELRDIFTKTVLEGQAQLIDSARKDLFVSIQPVDEAADYVLSSSQRRLWILSQLDEGSVAYNMPGVHVFKGQLNPVAFGDAFTALIERHEALRTIFRETESGDVRQVILPPAESRFRLELCDLRKDQVELNALIEAEAARPFDLVNGPLLRARLYRVADNRWVFTYVLHHIISDGWSMGILIRELLSFYNAQVNGEAHTLSPLRIQYKDYAAWQQQQLQGESLEAHRAYWLQQFEGELPVLEIPADHPRPPVKTYNGGLLSRVLDARRTQALTALGQEHGATLYMTLLAAVNALLYKYSSQEDIIIGSPIAGRQHADLESQIGFYLNTLALRNHVSGKQSFASLLTNVKQVTLDAYDHQAYPFDQLLDELDLRRDTSRHPLFDVMVILQNAGSHDHIGQGLDGLTVSGYERENQASKFDWLFDFSPIGEELDMSIAYNSDIYDPATAERMASHLEELIDSIIDQPTATIDRLNYLSESERELVVEVFNDTAAEYPREQTLPALFEAQAALRPEATALVFEDRSFTYADLNAQANQLARYLRAHYPLQADDRIVVQLERSERMIISLLAVLKAGAAYVPVDPHYPAERIAYMVQDSHCKALLTEEELDRFFLEQDRYSKDNLETLSRPTDLAYVIYTSGSTGRPKGCLLEHRGVINRLEWMWAHYGFDQSDVILQKTTFTFDVSVWELFLPLCWGAKMVLCRRDDIAAPERIASLIEKHGVTCLHFVPGMLNTFIAALNEEASLSHKLGSLRRVITSGEALLPATVSQWYDKLDTLIHNLYGPTEASVDVTYYATQPNDTVIPIGRPIWNTQLYILDGGNQPSGIGVAGELCIGGDGLARGYLNRPELTEERFVPNPFRENTRLYRTGDIGRWLPDGNIEYLGRRDEQVKIRGYRIELGEIETALQQHQSVEAAAVLAIADTTGDKELVAYLVGTASAEELRDHLGARLPMYMVPQHYVSVEALPLTASGKTDRRALAQLGRPEGSGREYIAPRTETEQKLVAVWQDILGRERIGIRDNFFDLGGHSLKATRLISRVRKEFNVEIDLKNIFREPTIEVMADTIVNQTWFQEETEEESYDEVRI